jgi:putative phage-type endonuclease
MDQRTEEWFEQRAGKVTASRVSDVIAKTKSGYSASRANYLAQLVAERLTGKPAESYSNAAMEWGTVTEPYARAAYESKADVLVDEVGFVLHPSIEFSGASPDGLVGDVGLLEVKCPNTATHIDYLLGKVVPPKYKPQMAWQLACTKREWCDFVSFDPRLPERHQLFVVRYIPEDGYIQELEAEVSKFLGEVQETINKLENL